MMASTKVTQTIRLRYLNDTKLEKLCKRKWGENTFVIKVCIIALEANGLIANASVS